jgi:hypothetical protein
MSKIFINSLFVLLFSVLSCKSGGQVSSRTDPSEIQGDLRYRTITTERSIMLYPERRNSPRMYFNLALLDISGPEPAQPLLLDTLYQGQSPEQYADSLISLFEDQYRAAGNLEEPDAEEPAASLNWEYFEAFQCFDQTPHTAVLSQSREYYIGGAHGMREQTYFVFSLDEVRWLRLDDIFAEGTEPALQEHIMEVLRIRQGLAPDAPLTGGGFFEDSVAVSEDFFLSRKGIGFQWDVYEIAPYVMGPIEIIIPYEKIRTLLTSRGLSLVQEFL